MNQNKLHQIGNSIGLIIICALLTVSFADQLGRHDLPCPLCLLQRICFVAVGLCLCMNLKIGMKTSHYGLMTLSAALGFAVALRQLFLHVAPGDPGYGLPILGLHMYVWSAIAFAVIIGLIAIALLFEKGFTEKQPSYGWVNYTFCIFFLLLIFANGISTLMECGTLICPANPVGYRLLNAN